MGFASRFWCPGWCWNRAPDAKRAVQTMDMKAGSNMQAGRRLWWHNGRFPAAGATPLTVTTRLAVSGYTGDGEGPGGNCAARELAHLAGMADAGMLDGLAGDAAQVDLSAEGPWLAPAGRGGRSPERNG